LKFSTGATKSWAARRDTGHPFSTLAFEQCCVEGGAGAVVTTLEDEVGAGRVVEAGGEVEIGREVEVPDEVGDFPFPQAVDTNVAIEARRSPAVVRRRLPGTGAC
jgi:hypothetical protein